MCMWKIHAQATLPTSSGSICDIKKEKGIWDQMFYCSELVLVYTSILNTPFQVFPKHHKQSCNTN